VVDTADIMSLYERARWKEPSNPADIIGKAADKMYFAPYEGQTVDKDTGNSLKKWRLTNTGIDYLQSLRNEEQ